MSKQAVHKKHAGRRCCWGGGSRVRTVHRAGPGVGGPGAEGAARELRHGYIGTEHLLLGVAGIGDGVGARGCSSGWVSGPTEVLGRT